LILPKLIRSMIFDDIGFRVAPIVSGRRVGQCLFC
jgi:hypothetical protein